MSSPAQSPENSAPSARTPVALIVIGFLAFVGQLIYALSQGSSPRIGLMMLFGGLAAAFAILTIGALRSGEFIGIQRGWSGLGGRSDGSRLSRATTYLGLCLLFTIVCLQTLPTGS